MENFSKKLLLTVTTFVEVRKPLLAGIVVGVAAAAIAPLCVGVGRNAIEAFFSRRRRALLSSVREAKIQTAEAQIATAEEWLRCEDATLPLDGDVEEKYANMSLTMLRSELILRRISSRALLRIFLRRALAAHAKTNCICCLMLPDAIEAAGRADELYERLDPIQLDQFKLLGIPLSIKENIAFAGTDCTLGLIGKCFQPIGEDSGSVKLLKQVGAVIFVKTNVPALLFSYECESILRGHTRNPISPEATAGGSSGGVGALIALRGSAGGIGTDIGGSLRIPSAFCGIAALKPTFLRVSSRGNRPIRGDESIPSVTGPMARTVPDLTVMFRCLTPSGPSQLVDGMVSQVPFQDSLYQMTLSRKKLNLPSGWIH